MPWLGGVTLFAAEPPVVPPNQAARSASLSFGGRWARTPGELMSRAGDVIEGVRDGWLKLNIDTVLPLECAREAHALIESRRSQGKIVLAVSVES
jgi:NADPH:quinone reductase-like Zn-dependent oxidoreductase